MNSKTLNSIIALCFCSFFVQASESTKQTPPHGKQNSRIFKIPKYKTCWQPDNGDLDVFVYQQACGAGELEIRKNSSQIFTFAPGAGHFPMKLFELQDGNLATLWYHNDGLRHLYVFSSNKGKIVKVLEATSLLDPEFVYQNQGSVGKAENGKLNPTLGKTHFYTQRIIMAEVVWQPSQDKTKEPSVLKPVRANIFNWNAEKMKYEKKTTSWDSRLQ